jgi:hypothetical protein
LSISSVNCAAELPAAAIEACTKYRVEYFIGVLPDGQPCQPFDKNVWFRGKADAAVWGPTGAWLVDWKTGKLPQRWEGGRPQGEDPFELECQGMLLHAHHGPFPALVGQYFGLKEGRAGALHTIDPKATRQKVQEIDNRMRHFHQNDQWPKTPGPLCGWCPVVKCQHNRNRDAAT